MTKRGRFEVPPAPPGVVAGSRVRIVGGSYNGLCGEYVRAHASNGWHYVRIAAPGLDGKIISPLVPAVELAPTSTRTKTK